MSGRASSVATVAVTFAPEASADRRFGHVILKRKMVAVQPSPYSQFAHQGGIAG
jgi:hypothetical protein